MGKNSVFGIEEEMKNISKIPIRDEISCEVMFSHINKSLYGLAAFPCLSSSICEYNANKPITNP